MRHIDEARCTHYCTSDEEREHERATPEPAERGVPDTLDEFTALYLSDLIALWSLVKAEARETAGPHLLQFLDFERFAALAFRTS